VRALVRELRVFRGKAKTKVAKRTAGAAAALLRRFRRVLRGPPSYCPADTTDIVNALGLSAVLSGGRAVARTRTAQAQIYITDKLARVIRNVLNGLPGDPAASLSGGEESLLETSGSMSMLPAKTKTQRTKAANTCPYPRRSWRWKPVYIRRCDVRSVVTAYVVFRDTVDVATSMKQTTLVPCGRLKGCQGGRARRDVVQAVSRLRQRIYYFLRKLRNASPVQKVVFVGHGVGGAMAAVMALDALHGDHLGGLSYSLVTSGQSPVGDSRLSRAVERGLPRYPRIVTHYPAVSCSCRPKWLTDALAGAGSHGRAGREVGVPCETKNNEVFAPWMKPGALAKCAATKGTYLNERLGCHSVVQYMHSFCWNVAPKDKTCAKWMRTLRIVSHGDPTKPFTWRARALTAAPFARLDSRLLKQK